MSKKQEKRLSLRQQMRVEGEKHLDHLIEGMIARCVNLCNEGMTQVNPGDVMRLASGVGENKSLRHNLITELANEAEAELMKLWNNQQDLPMETPDANEKG